MSGLPLASGCISRLLDNQALPHPWWSQSSVLGRARKGKLSQTLQTTQTKPMLGLGVKASMRVGSVPRNPPTLSKTTTRSTSRQWKSSSPASPHPKPDSQAEVDCPRPMQTRPVNLDFPKNPRENSGIDRAHEKAAQKHRVNRFFHCSLCLHRCSKSSTKALRPLVTSESA